MCTGAAMIPWLIGDDPFPALDAALDEPNGLLAASEGLGPARLLAAYRRGTVFIVASYSTRGHEQGGADKSPT